LTREQKLALVLGFAAVLVVGLLISDHLAAARSAGLEDAPHDATVLVDASEGQALRRVVTLPETEDHYRGRPVQRLARQPEASQDAVSPQTQTNDPSMRMAAVEDREEPVEVEEPREPIRLVLGSNGGVSDPDQGGRRESVLERVGDSMAHGAEAVARGIRDIAGLATSTPLGGMAELGDRPGEPVGRDVPTAPRVVQHHVQANESLYKIAAQYYGDGNQWRRIARDNQGRVSEDGSVREGVTLRILDPRVGSTPEQVVARAPVKPDVRPIAKPEVTTGPVTYTVKSGDTLGEISQKLLGTVRRQHELIALNRDVLKDPDNLRAGTVLKLPSS
jgi:nucleoid-associated protein YgaU